MPQTLDYKQWYDLGYRNYALTIADVINLKPGQQLKFLCMDRNVWDIALKDDIRGKSMKPQEFFKSNWVVYEHVRDLHGKFLLFSFEDDKANITDDGNGNVQVIDVDLEKICRPNFEFEIEYKPHHWYPLIDQYLPASDSQQITEFDWNSPQHWSAFDKNTRVGWRGYFVLWSKLTEMPDIIWPYPKEAFNAFYNETDVHLKRNFEVIVKDKNASQLIKNKIFVSETSKSCVRSLIWDLTNDCDADPTGGLDESTKMVPILMLYKMGKYLHLNVTYPYVFDIHVVETTPNTKHLTYVYKANINKNSFTINKIKYFNNKQYIT